MNYKVILFDADGITIVCEKFSSRMEKDYGTAWNIMKPFFDGPFLQCKLGKADLKDELQKVMGSWGWPGSVEELMIYWFSIGVTVNNEIIELVKTLRVEGVKCYLATNQTSYRANYLRDGLGLGTIFDGFYISAQIGHLKNEPVFFETVLRDQGSNISPAEVLFIDNEEQNLASAAQVGLATHSYQNFSSLKTFLQKH